MLLIDVRVILDLAGVFSRGSAPFLRVLRESVHCSWFEVSSCVVMAGNFFKDGDVILLAIGKNSRSGVKLAALPLAPNGELAEEQSRYLPSQTYLPKFVQEKKVRNTSFIRLHYCYRIYRSTCCALIYQRRFVSLLTTQPSPAPF